MNGRAAFPVTVARTAGEIEALRPFWKDVCRHPYCDPDFFSTVLAVREEVTSPHVIVAGERESPRALLVGRIENHRLPLIVGYKIFATLRVKALCVLHPGIMGADFPGRGELFFRALAAALERGEADVVYLSQQRIDSGLFGAAAALSGALRRDRFLKPSIHWRSAVRGSFEDFLKTRSANTRGNMRRYGKRLEREFPGRVAVRSFRDPADCDALVAAVKKVYGNTYQRHTIGGRKTEAEMRALFETAMEQGWMRAYVLEIDGAPRAFWYGHLYKETFFILSTGFDPSLERFHPGTYLLTRMLGEIFDEGPAKALDFGWGDAQYKRSLGETKWTEASMYLFPPTPRGMAFCLLKTATNGAGAAAARVLKELNSWNKVRRAWRKRLAERSGAS